MSHESSSTLWLSRGFDLAGSFSAFVGESLWMSIQALFTLLLQGSFHMAFNFVERLKT